MGKVIELDSGLGRAVQRLAPIDGASAEPACLRPPTLADIFDSLERVDPFKPTALVMRSDVWARVGPEYDRLARACDPRCSGAERRAAWKRWRQQVQLLRRQFEHEEHQ